MLFHSSKSSAQTRASQALFVQNAVKNTLAIETLPDKYIGGTKSPVHSVQVTNGNCYVFSPESSRRLFHRRWSFISVPLAFTAIHS